MKSDREKVDCVGKCRHRNHAEKLHSALLDYSGNDEFSFTVKNGHECWEVWASADADVPLRRWADLEMWCEGFLCALTTR